MRPGMVFTALIVLFGVAAASATAEAKPRVTVSTKYYSISGKTGPELLRQMNRKGPRHGFLTRAIAQTWYSPKPDGDLVYENGVCRVKKPKVTMKIVYTYPKPREKLSAKMQRRWKRFMNSVVKHEKRHGQIAVQMATAMERHLRRFKVEDRADCRRAIRRLKRDINAIWKKWDLKQIAFDKTEHSKNGPVERIVQQLVK